MRALIRPIFLAMVAFACSPAHACFVDSSNPDLWQDFHNGNPRDHGSGHHDGDPQGHGQWLEALEEQDWDAPWHHGDGRGDGDGDGHHSPHHGGDNGDGDGEGHHNGSGDPNGGGIPAVPLPAGAPLFLSGLLGFALWARFSSRRV